MKLKQLITSLLLSMAFSACNAPSNRPADLETTPNEKPEDLYIKLGEQYYNLEKYEVALKYLEKALAINSKSSSAHDRIGILYQKLERPTKARSHFQQAVMLRPSNASAQNNFAGFLCTQGELTIAQKHFKLAYENPLNPNQIIAITNAGSCALIHNDLVKAEIYFDQALDQNPNFSQALKDMAILRSKQGDHLSARGFLQRFQSTGAKPTAEILWLGVQTELALGDERAAQRYKKTLFEQFPKSKQAVLARQAISGF